MSVILLVLVLRQESLIERLASDDPGQREKAAAALIEMGPAARSMLKGWENNRDPDVRAELRHVLSEIDRRERISVLRPRPRRSTIALARVPAAEAAKQVFAPYGIEAELRGSVPDVSLELKGATLWEALEAFSEATGLRPCPITDLAPRLLLGAPDPKSSREVVVVRDDVRVAARVVYRRTSASAGGDRDDAHVVVNVALPPGHRPLDWDLEQVRLFAREEVHATGNKGLFRIPARASPTGLSVWEAPLPGRSLQVGDLLRLEGTLVLRYPHDARFVQFDLRSFPDKMTKELDGWEITAYKTAIGVDTSWQSVNQRVEDRFLGWFEDAGGAAVHDYISTVQVKNGGYALISKFRLWESAAVKYTVARVIGDDDLLRIPVLLRDIPVPAR